VLSCSVPEGAGAARLGGDEFVVMLPGAGADVAEALGARIRGVLAEGLTEAGFPLRISAGISTYPFDGAGPTALLRAADQALYAAKEAGKDRVASFRDLVRPDPTGARPGTVASADEHRRGSRGGGSVLAEAVAAATAIEAEENVEKMKALLLEADKAVKAIEKHQENWLAEWKKEMAQKEQRVGEEITLARFVRDAAEAAEENE